MVTLLEMGEDYFLTITLYNKWPHLVTFNLNFDPCTKNISWIFSSIRKFKEKTIIETINKHWPRKLYKTRLCQLVPCYIFTRGTPPPSKRTPSKCQSFQIYWNYSGHCNNIYLLFWCFWLIQVKTLYISTIDWLNITFNLFTKQFQQNMCLSRQWFKPIVYLVFHQLPTWHVSTCLHCLMIIIKPSF